MVVVYFYENKNLLLHQFLDRIPSVGEELTIKGRIGKVTSVNAIDEKHIHVNVNLATFSKKTIKEDTSKKKKR